MEENSPEGKNNFDHQLNKIDEALDECDRQLNEKFGRITQDFNKLKKTLKTSQSFKSLLTSSTKK